MLWNWFESVICDWYVRVIEIKELKEERGMGRKQPDFVVMVIKWD